MKKSTASKHLTTSLKSIFIFFIVIVFFGLNSFSQEVRKGERHVAIKHDTINIKQLAEKEKLHPTVEKELKIPNRYGEDEKDEDEGGIPHNLKIPPGAIINKDENDFLNRTLPSSNQVLSPAPTVNFNGLDDAGNSIPPDVNGAVGPNHLMITLNTEYRIQTRAGVNVSTVDILSFWTSLGGVSSPFDPKTLYDPYNNRWITVAVSNRRSASSSILIAVSQTNDPTGTWNRYMIDATSADTMFIDYPSVGFSKDWIVISGNMYGNVGGNFQTGHAYALNKANFYAGGSGQYTLINAGGSGFTLAPATTYDNSISTMYLVQTWNGSSGSIRLSTITGAIGSESLTGGNFATTANTWSSGTGTDFAPQATVANKFQCNDDRMLSCVYRNGAIWCAHTVFLPATTPTRCSLQWWKLTTVGGVTARDRIDDPTGVNFYAFPSLSVNSSNDALIGYSKFSATTFASAGYSLKLATDANFQSDFVFKAGLAKYYKIFSGNRNRWGDYTMTQVDPVNDNDFWTLQEYASTPVSGSDHWGTWWANVTATNTPLANFNADITTSCTNSNVTFANASSGNYTTYAWDFGAGATPATSSSSGPVVVQYSTTGLKTISLTVSGPSGSNTNTKTDYMNVIVPPAAAGAIGGSLNVCQGQNGVPYVVPVISGATGYTWTLPVGATIASGDNTNSITVNYNSTALSGTVSVNGFNAGCTGASSSVAVTVGAAPSKTGSLTFTNATPITINDAAAASPYPSTISVSGFVGAVQDVNVLITGFSHTWKGDVDILLESPTGQRIILSSDCGEIASSTSINLTFNDSAGSFLPSGSALVTGSFKPTNYESPDGFPSPGPGLSFASNAGTFSSPLSTFNLFNPNGTWKLFVIDDGAGDVGSIASWSLTIIGAVPNSAPVISGTGTVCQNQNAVPYNITPVSGATGYNWSLPSGASIASGVNTNSITVNFSGGATSGNISVTPNNTCGNSTSSAVFGVAVNPSVTASVAITAAPPDAICEGTNVIFTATPTNGGSPSYQWKKNGTNVGTNSTTYSDNALNSNDSISCVMTSNASCVSGSPASSATVTMTVIPSVTANVSVAALPSGSICTGSNVTFTASPSNGGATPSYQWKKNGTNIGTNSTTYSDNALNNNDSIRCVMTSNATCVLGNPASSATKTMTVSQIFTPSVSIAALPAGAICSGNSVTFTASPTHGGFPSYQWKKNGTNVGTALRTYSDNALNNNDSIRCVMTSSVTCVTGSTASSAAITMTVNPNVTASVSIAALPSGEICSGTNVTFTATPANGGTTPSYQWKKNGTNVGTNSITYTDNALNSNDSIRCLMTSSEPCVSESPSSSATIVISTTTCQVTLNLKIFIEGFYLGNDLMVPMLYNNGLSSDSTACDSITVELRIAADPNILFESQKGLLHKNGRAELLFPSSTFNGLYYVVVRHRNGLETWSKDTVLFNSVIVNFDFTSP